MIARCPFMEFGHGNEMATPCYAMLCYAMPYIYNSTAKTTSSASSKRPREKGKREKKRNPQHHLLLFPSAHFAFASTSAVEKERALFVDICNPSSLHDVLNRPHLAHPPFLQASESDGKDSVCTCGGVLFIVAETGGPCTWMSFSKEDEKEERRGVNYTAHGSDKEFFVGKGKIELRARFTRRSGEYLGSAILEKVG